MNEDPQRLVNLGGPAALLVASAKEDSPSDESFQSAVARLGVAGVTVAGAVVATTVAKGAAAGTTAASGSAALGTATQAAGLSLFAKLSIGVSVALVAVGGTIVATSKPDAAQPAATTARTVESHEKAPTRAPNRPEAAAIFAAPDVSAPAAAGASAPASTTASAASSVAPVALPATAQTNPPSAQALPSGDVQPRPDVRDEIVWLDRARSELAAGNARGAIATLDQHAKDFARGSLGMEAEMLRIEAMIRGDQPSEGRARGAALLARDPNGPYAKRLRTLVER